jgi:nitroreductase/NAD-dependent dihydropyrimidine dehydrogenase PreA subunit
MSQIFVDEELCSKDGVCVDVCPARALRMGASGFPEEIPENGCILCGHCAAVCPRGALTHHGLPEGELVRSARELPGAELMDGFLIGRRSVRVYRDEPVEKETLDALLDVARHAPTASNTQQVHWIVVNGREKVHALAEEIVNGIRMAGQAAGRYQSSVDQWDRGYDFVLRGAPTLVVACAPSESAWGRQDCSIALTFLELAAEARGLGACWAGYLTYVAGLYEPLQKALELPAGYTVCGGLMLGRGKYVYRKVPPRNSLSVQWL